MEWMLGIDILTVMNVHMTPNFLSLFLIAISLLYLSLIIVSFKKVKPYIALLFGVSYIFAMYFGLMLSLSL
ncbi:hypothetical protein AABM38_02655 [Heyndrickxia sp. MSNUG]|uniref:hypothetical protein n=1 Tax=Heyndrickxia sp. MSNUG TaxID=3136677 RepID=UPI003C2CB470